MKHLIKKILILIIFFASSCASIKQKEDFNLIGKWISKKGQGVGFFADKKAPYSIEFNQESFSALEKKIAAKYKKQSELIEVTELDNDKNWKIKIIDNNTIQFNYPGIGLRRYNKITE